MQVNSIKTKSQENKVYHSSKRLKIKDLSTNSQKDNNNTSILSSKWENQDVTLKINIKMSSKINYHPKDKEKNYKNQG